MIKIGRKGAKRNRDSFGVNWSDEPEVSTLERLVETTDENVNTEILTEALKKVSRSNAPTFRSLVSVKKNSSIEKGRNMTSLGVNSIQENKEVTEQTNKHWIFIN